jgi:hypothetical protein
MKAGTSIFREFQQSLFAVGLVACAAISSSITSAQTLTPGLKPDMRRALDARHERWLGQDRPNGYLPRQSQKAPLRAESSMRTDFTRAAIRSGLGVTPAISSILPGTPLPQVLHTSQISLSSSAGADEQFMDRSGDLVADERTTFDSAGGSFDIAVGQSGTRYEVYSATVNNTPVGVIVIARDTNGDYQIDTSNTYNLRTDFSLPSAAAVVTGTSKAGREFVIVSSSGYYNASDQNDPNNEPSPGVILLVRDPATGGFDPTLSRQLVKVGDNKLYNANALALLPNNELLIADFHSNELRIVRDTDNDGVPDTLSTTPYYSYRFSNDAPLEVAVNSRGVVFSHSTGNDTIILALYDDNHDGAADRDEVCVAGLSIDNNIFLHGLIVDGAGNVYVIEDASGPADGGDGNGGRPTIDAFPDQRQDGFLTNGSIFTFADDAVSLGLTGLAFGALPPNKIDDPQFFVIQHYLDFLNRDPDASGRTFWTNDIISCGTNAQCIQVKRINVSAAFFVSIEFQETGYLVYRFYKAAYGNLKAVNGNVAEAPVPLKFDEFLLDTRQIGQGVEVGVGNWQAQLDANKQNFATQFVARSRFTAAYPTSLTPAQFVDALFTNAGVAPTTTERNAAINEFGQSATTTDAAARARALRSVAENPTLAKRELNRAFVLMQYFGYLRRNPYDAPEPTLDYQGYNFWLTKLNQFNGDYIAAEMVKAFIESSEYRSRFAR